MNPPHDKYQMDMTHGPLLSKIVIFSIPLMFSYILQMLFNTADLIVVGRFGSADALAAVGATTGLTHLVLNVFFGLSVGVNVLTARYFGAKDRKNISDTVHTAAAVSLYGGVIMAAIGILVSRQVLELMATPAAILDKSAFYMRLYCAGIPFIVLYNFGSSVLRAQGDTRRPLFFMILAGILNVLLNLFFVLVCRMDSDGVALATLIANIFSAIPVVAVQLRSPGPSRLVWKKIRLHGSIFRDMVKIGLPAGIQGSSYSISSVIIQSAINTFGAAAIAGNTAAYSLEGLVLVASESFYYTGITFLGQNHGAKKYKRILRCIFWCLTCSTVISLVAGFGCWLAGPELLGIYNSDPEVIKWGMIRVKILFSMYFLNGLMDALSGVLRGLGHSLKPTVVIILGACGFRVLWVLWIFPHYRTMENLMISYPVSWALVSVINGAILFYVCRRMFREAAQGLHHHDGRFGTLQAP